MKRPPFHALGTAAAALAIVFTLAASPASAEDRKPAYRIESVPLPKGFDPEIGALSFNQGGELVVVSRRTGILFGQADTDPAKFKWRTFCDQSLHDPFGVLVEAGGSLLVPQMPELTRLYDSDKDGVADYFETVSTAWGITGNRHETNCGPLPDGDGNWLVALGTAGANGATFDRVRGDYSPAGRRGQSFSAAPWKGWIVKVTPTGEILPWASGFRRCNGLVMNADGELFATDSRGDWKATSSISHIEEGQFHGHPASLVWDADFFAKHPDPLTWAVENIDAIDQMRTRPSIHLPHGTICNAAGQPAFIPSGERFGPFAGQVMVGDSNAPRILRVMLEKVDGHYQGAVTHFIDRPELGGGNQRLCFSPDGDELYVGQAALPGSDEPAGGLKRIRWSGRAPYAVQNLSLAADGFELAFTEGIDRKLAGDPANYSVKHYTHAYGHMDDAPPIDVTEIAPRQAIITPDARGVVLQFDDLEPGRIYEFDLAGIRSASGDALEHGPICYTLNRLRPASRSTIEFKSPSQPSTPAPPATATEKGAAPTVSKPEPEPEPAPAPESKPEPEPAEDKPTHIVTIGGSDKEEVRAFAIVLRAELKKRGFESEQSGGRPGEISVVGASGEELQKLVRELRKDFSVNAPKVGEADDPEPEGKPNPDE